MHYNLNRIYQNRFDSSFENLPCHLIVYYFQSTITSLPRILISFFYDAQFLHGVDCDIWSRDEIIQRASLPNHFRILSVAIFLPSYLPSRTL